MRTRGDVSLRLGLAAMCLGLLGAAGDPATQRIALMKEMSGALRLLGSATSGMLPVDSEVERGARTLHADSLALGGLFPPGSMGAEGRALEAIWSDRATFDADMAAFQQAAGGMVAAVTARDASAMRPAFAALAGSCLQCHDRFRRP